MKKKILLAVFTAMVMFSIFSVTAFGASGVSIWGDNLTSTYDDSTGILTISGEGSIRSWDNPPESETFDALRNQVKTIVINEGVTYIGRYVFSNFTNLTSVTIPSSVTHISDSAFLNCHSLTELHIPTGVKSIGADAFAGCYGIKKVVIENGLTRIAGGVFRNCTALTTVDIPNSVKEIGGGVFLGCSNLREVVLPEGLKSIGDRTFKDCKGLDSITIPKTVTSVGTSAFENCWSLTFVYYGGCEEDWNQIIIGDKNDRLVDVPKHYGQEFDADFAENVTKNYGDDSFIKEAVLVKGDGIISYDSSNPAVATVDNNGRVTIVSAGTTTISATAERTLTYSKKIVSYELTVNPKTISKPVADDTKFVYTGNEQIYNISASDDYMISNNKRTSAGRQTVTVALKDKHNTAWEDGTNSDLEFSFYIDKAEQIFNQSFADKIDKFIGNSTFNKVAILTQGDGTITYSSSDTSVATVDNDGKVIIKSAGTTIITATAAETVNYKVTTISYTLRVASKGIQRFNSDFANDITKTQFDDTFAKTAILFEGDGTITYSSSDTSVATVDNDGVVTIKGTGTTIITAIAAETTNYERETISYTLKVTPWQLVSGSCGDNAVWTLDRETGQLSIKGTGAISDYSYSSLPSWNDFSYAIKSIKIENGITHIGSYSFCDDGTHQIKYKFLTKIDIADTVTSIGAYAFQDAKNLSSVMLTEGLQSIGDYAFSGCGQISDIVLPSSLSNVGESAFSGTGLVDVVVPGNVKEIKRGAFWSTNLKSIVFQSGVQKINYGAFVGNGLTSITFPDTLEYIGNQAFESCRNLKEITIPENTSLGNWAFRYCDNLQNIKFLDGTKRINASAFQGDTNLLSVTIPNSVESISSDGFENVTDVYYSGSKEHWEWIEIENRDRTFAKATIHCSGTEPAPTIQKPVFNEDFAKPVTKTLGDPEFVKTVTLIKGDGFIQYIKSTDNVATVNSDTGEVTINGVGTTRITAYFYPTSKQYDYGSISYTLTVKAKDQSSGIGGGGSSGGGGGGGSVTPPPTKGKPTVSTNGNGGTVSADDNGKVTITPNTGYKIKDVTVNGKSVGAKTELTGLTSDDKVVVTFEKIDGEENPVVTQPTTKFADVQNHWAAEAINYVVEKGMMNGVGSKQFEPNQSTSRAMIVTILYRLENEPAVTGSSNFKDVADGQYYSKAVAWANANGIVTGYSDTEFVPNGNITREQMSSILSRYAKYKGVDTTSTGSLGNFADGRYVSNYAQGAMSWAVDMKLIQGDSGKLNPTAGATRAEVATILMRYCENILK